MSCPRSQRKPDGETSIPGFPDPKTEICCPYDIRGSPCFSFLVVSSSGDFVFFRVRDSPLPGLPPGQEWLVPTRSWQRPLLAFIPGRSKPSEFVRWTDMTESALSPSLRACAGSERKSGRRRTRLNELRTLRRAPFVVLNLFNKIDLQSEPCCQTGASCEGH